MERFLLSNISPNYYDPKQDLKKLKQKLTSFQDLLVDGEARRQSGEENVDEWMDDLKDLLYDVEPILDDLKSLSNDQVRPYALFTTSDELKKGLGEILDRTEGLRDRARDLELKRGSGHACSGQSKVTMSTRETSSMVNISEIHGREKDQADIINRLLEVNAKRKLANYDVVGIWGMGGLGKTTLAQLVFNDPKFEKHFEVRRWVCISDDFDVRRAIKGLIGDDSAGNAESLEILHQRLQIIIQNKRFLFVLDDMWPSTEWNEKWDMINVLFNSCRNGSKILVTTRDCNEAQTLGDEKPYQLKGLPHEQCISLFKDKAFGNADIDEAEIEKLMIYGKKIVGACQGLPLAVKVIGSMLQREKEDKWQAVAENTNYWDMNDIKLHPAIRLSYHYMPAFLKRCFEYMAVFPPDHWFHKNDVVCLWIADGLVQADEGRRAEDTGSEYYNELKARSLIQENNRMHDIVQHLATVVSRKFCYKGNSKEAPASVRHAFLVNGNSMHYKFLAQYPYLRTVIVERPHEDENVLGNAIRSWKMLRTLKIKFHGNYSLGKSSTCHLTHLRYLSISALNSRHLLDSVCMLDNLKFLFLYRMHLKELPKDIGNLRSLRTLNLAESSISSLPDSICSLCQLQDLGLAFCGSLKELPKDIGNLWSLRTLDLERSSISSLPESICSLCQLQDLNLSFCSSLKELPKDMGNLRSLQTLNLEGSSISSLPESICSLYKLRALFLQYCKELKELPKDMGNLRSLQTLDVRGTSNLRMPQSVLNVTGLQKFFVSESIQLPIHIGRLEGLKGLPVYHVEKDMGRRLGELNLLNRLEGKLTIASMENIEGVEEAEMVDLKSKKNVTDLGFSWSQPGNDEEMEVKIMEALQPHHAIKYLTFSNYGGNKFPAWIMAGNICLTNLLQLTMNGLNKICEIIDMEFVLLNFLRIEDCPKLRKVIMATPQLDGLTLRNCGELEADSVHLLLSLSDEIGLHSIVSQLRALFCDYYIFEYFFEKLKTANLKWDNLWWIELSGGGRRVASLPGGWPSMMDHIKSMEFGDIGPGKFQLLPDGDKSSFPPSLRWMKINNCVLPLTHYCYTITSDGKVETSIDNK